MPLRNVFGSRGSGQVPDPVIIYGEVVVITIVGLFLVGCAGVWLWTELQSPNGLSATEIASFLNMAFNAVIVTGVWRLAAQTKAVGEQTNGELSTKLDTQTEDIVRRSNPNMQGGTPNEGWREYE